MDVKELRKRIDELVYDVEKRLQGEMLNADYGRAFSLVRTKLQEAKMWAGKVLEAENKPLPKEYVDHCKERLDDEGKAKE